MVPVPRKDRTAEEPRLEEEISHRLRTPLTALTTYLTVLDLRLERQQGLLTNGVEDATQFTDLARAALLSAGQLACVLDGLLDRPTRARRPPRPQQASIGRDHERPMGDRRFDERWHEFDARLRAGEPRAEVLSSLRDDQLVELLAASAAAHRPFDRNVIATALLNRKMPAGARNDPTLSTATVRPILLASRTAAQTRRLLAEHADLRAMGERRRGAFP